MTDHSSSGSPQFATAEYPNRPGEVSCKACGQKIASAYYSVNGAPVCAACTRRLQDSIPKDSHQAFVRGLSFGIGAAVLGFVLYVVFALSTGLVIGFVSLAVGYLVGKAIIMGSRGVGGRRYQIAAVVLTYIAVSLAAVPIGIGVHMKHKQAQQHSQAGTPAAPAGAETAPAAPKPKMSFAKAVGTLTLIGLASPFLDMVDPVHGIIGLIILLVGIRIAWQLTAGKTLNVSGPLGAPATASAN
jgi:hypothetical protein